MANLGSLNFYAGTGYARISFKFTTPCTGVLAFTVNGVARPAIQMPDGTASVLVGALSNAPNGQAYHCSYGVTPLSATGGATDMLVEVDGNNVRPDPGNIPTDNPFTHAGLASGQTSNARIDLFWAA